MTKHEWLNNKLYYEGKDTGYSVEKDQNYQTMYRIKHPDGTLGEDFYNISRAKEHSLLEHSSIANRMPLEPTQKAAGALKKKIGTTLPKGTSNSPTVNFSDAQ